MLSLFFYSLFLVLFSGLFLLLFLKSPALLATTSKDRKTRVLDPRADSVVHVKERTESKPSVVFFFSVLCITPFFLSLEIVRLLVFGFFLMMEL